MSDLEAVAVQTGQVFYQGRLFERERIIKLLEDLDAWPAKFDRDEALEFVIALIKGEK